MRGKPGCYTLGVRLGGRCCWTRPGWGNPHPACTPVGPPCLGSCAACSSQTRHIARSQHTLVPPVSLPVQPRSFLELGRYILALDLPPETAQALQGLA